MDTTDPRGRTSVPNAVFTKLAEQAAREVRGVRDPAAGIVTGIGRTFGRASGPKAQVDVLGRTMVVRLDIGLHYPVNVSEACARVRHHVDERLRELAGARTTQIDIEVSALHVGSDSEGRALR